MTSPTEFREHQVVLDADGVRRALARMAREIVESNGGVDNLAIVGIHTGGVHLAHRLCALIAQDEGRRPMEGMIDITLYRDDVLIGLPQPVVGRTELPFELEGARIELIDDVLYTGRTVRSALDAIVDYGRPDTIRLSVLVDRGHRELPIQADCVGLTVPTQAEESVKVELTESGADSDRVALYRAVEQHEDDNRGGR